LSQITKAESGMKSPTPIIQSVGFGSSAGKGDAPSLSLAANQERRLANLSIPSIPSRFLTPVLKFDLHEKDGMYDGPNQRPNEQVTESILVAKVARLTNDGSKIGPGAYNVESAYKKSMASPKKVDNWAVDKTKRQENFVKKTTSKIVGPGAYNNANTLDTSI
jgi:hypothetical protein